MTQSNAANNTESQEMILATLRVDISGKPGAPRVITIDHLTTEGMAFCSDRELSVGESITISLRGVRDDGSTVQVTECSQHRGQYEVQCQFMRQTRGSISGAMTELLRERFPEPKTPPPEPADKRRGKRHATRDLGIIASGDAMSAACRSGIPVQLFDVSARGVQLQGRFTMEVNEQFTLFMRIGDNPVVMLCRVCRVIESTDKVRRIGAEFVQVNSKPAEAPQAIAA